MNKLYRNTDPACGHKGTTHKGTLQAILVTILVITLIAGAPGVLASNPYLGDAYRYTSIDSPLIIPDWQQANTNGFGDPLATEITTLEAYKGYLYAGTHSDANDALIYRSANGTSWTPVIQPGFGISHDIAPRAILDFIVFNNQLYTSTGRGGNPAQIYRTLDGLNWSPMVIHGFSNDDNKEITVLTEYAGMIYAGVTNVTSGVQIWRSFTGDNNSWTQMTTPTTLDTHISSFVEFNGDQYAAVESANGPAQVWLNIGSEWVEVVTDGFGDIHTTLLGGMAAFGGYLYVGAGNTVNGAQLWRTNDGMIWTQTITPGFGDPNNLEVEIVYVENNTLYASVRNLVTGMELWRSIDGTTWEKANQDGFGDPDNTSSNNGNSITNFSCQLYVGTKNTLDGGELWRMLQPYAVSLSADQAKTGFAGQDVIYTLTVTNTGSLADTINLSVSGQTWTSVLSTPQVSLQPSASVDFTLTVSIPPGTPNQATDTVSISAVSQGSPCAADSADLTTTNSTAPVYGVTLSADASLSGSAGSQVVYDLTVTNTGNTQDTLNLTKSGNSWTTSLSASSVVLAAGASTVVKVTVTIPSSSVNHDSDQVIIQAVSQHDPAKTDSAILTTVSTGSPNKVFIPSVMQNYP